MDKWDEENFYSINFKLNLYEEIVDDDDGLLVLDTKPIFGSPKEI